MEYTAEMQLDTDKLSFDTFRNEVCNDYRIACISRQSSLLARKEVLTGKAKFGIFGDGKEVAQVALAKFFKNGDFRSGYYRDQTFMMAIGVTNPQQFFAQLYADTNSENEPFSAGRQMNCHYSTPNVDAQGQWLALTKQKNSAADMAPTASQMPRSIGLALASKLFRKNAQLHGYTNLSNNGNEVCFTTIGDASTSEGHFYETINTASVLQVPLAIFVWDDGYGISVPKKYQTTKGSISTALEGFRKNEGDTTGINIYKVSGWDYAGMCEAFEEGIRMAREKHTPVLFHIEELTQPQGHSTSGSHERYKTPERLEWEKQWDCLRKMKEWMLENNLSSQEELEKIEDDAKFLVRQSRDTAWSNYLSPLKLEVEKAVSIIESMADALPEKQTGLTILRSKLLNIKEPLRRDIIRYLHEGITLCGDQKISTHAQQYLKKLRQENYTLYDNFLYNMGAKSALQVPVIQPVTDDKSPMLNGYEILNKYFDALFEHNPRVVAFGEDVGKIGDVNQGFSGLQAKYGPNRIFDTGIRELSIMGKGIGLALRGLRPIAEIQYLDYLLYGLQPLSDDVSSLHYRTAGRQSCPIIVRTRGHRLEGIWHSGSPMAMAINALRGMYICVPRNMVQAVGFYNTLLQGNDPGLIIEPLSGYRLKEALPDNITQYTIPLGIPQTVQEGDDITLVSYGTTLRIVLEAAAMLAIEHISCEVIDVQTLLPFDINSTIVESLKKTGRIIFIDEDVPGGATAYMYNQVIEKQGGYRYLDAAPRTLSAKEHRPAYGSDGDYFSKPNREDIIDMVRLVMAE